MTLLLEPEIRDWDFPRRATGIAVLVEHAEATGMPARTALAGTGLSVRYLAEAGREVTAEQELRVVRNLIRSDRPATRSAVALGRRYRVASFGIAGYALVSSRTLADAMDFALRYLDLTFTFSIPHARVDGDDVVIAAYSDTLPRDVRAFLVERDLAAIEAVLRELFLGDLPTRYDREAATVTFPASFLEAELPRASPAGMALAEELCAELAGRQRDTGPLVRQVRILIAQRLSYDPSLAGVAAALSVGERTLRRRLAVDGTSYQGLLDEVRAELAAQLLATGSLTVAQIARRLGYAHAGSFVDAHRRWHGRTPTGRGSA
ncbi:AraC family transcriptional regulator [Nocardioides marmoriginsengisoli]|uniref:AraC family transcriptional regulator n=1 Tax=Nocardioides marmoriginsengisoli TaxID=661483 RepID=UPI00161122BC|nr:AraC family transcriptional regulator [Nocardioides marmoriginsengisoli]